MTVKGLGGLEGLEGVRVLEVAGGMGVAWAAKLFADLGADVIRLEHQGGDTVRSRPDDVHRWINANKRSAGAARLDELLADADVVFHDLGPTAAASRGLDFGQLGGRFPRLVVCSFTPFGMTGPYADYAGEELTVMHGSSWGFLSPSAATSTDLPPIKAYGHHATFFTATIAATAALAAFDRVAVNGRGEHVDFAAFAAGAKLTETAPASFSYLGQDASRVGVKTVVPWGLYSLRDGLLQFICVEDAQWKALCRLMGDPEWTTLDVFATNADRRENSDLVELYVSEWMATQDVADLYHRGQAARMCVSPVNTMAQLDADAQFAARGFFAETAEGVKVPGPGFQLDTGWWGQRRPAPDPAEHDGEGWAERPSPVSADDGRAGGTEAAAAAAVAVAVSAERPLAGVRVCDFTWIWAGPFCTQILAHLGADVIRLESPEHQCLFRRLPFTPDGLTPTPDTAGLFHLYNSDKRSVRIDLAHPDAREVITRLVARSDVVVENFAVGTLAKLGYGVEDLRRINPDLIIASLTGYGQTGPSAGYMAYGPAGGAVGGLYAVTGYEGGRPCETGIAIGDPGTGITGAWAVVAALAARRRTGRAARVDVAMVEAIAATMGEAWMRYLAEGEQPALLGNHDPVWSPHDVYPAAGHDQWVTIACTSEEQWRALCSVVKPDLADDPRFATAADRKEHEAALDDLLAGWTAARDRWEVTRTLQAVGVAAFPSLSPADLWGGDRQLEAIGMLERPDHPATGTHTVPGIPWRLTNGPNGLRRPAPCLGQHTEEVLVEVLGFDPDDVARLSAAGVLP